MVVLAHLQRRWSLSAFMGMKHLFSFAPKARKGGEVVGETLIGC
jgi:hypothetical protein